MKKLELFVQVEGDKRTAVVLVDPSDHVAAIGNAARAQGLPVPTDGTMCFVGDLEDPVREDAILAQLGITDRARVHLHRCRRIEVEVHFGKETAKHRFPPNATVGRVYEWAAKKLIENDVDRGDHVLQLCNSTNRPSVDLQIGALIQATACQLCFDLVPVQRVEG